jgi:hypothetical protein
MSQDHIGVFGIQTDAGSYFGLERIGRIAVSISQGIFGSFETQTVRDKYIANFIWVTGRTGNDERIIPSTTTMTAIRRQSQKIKEKMELSLHRFVKKSTQLMASCSLSDLMINETSAAPLENEEESIPNNDDDDDDAKTTSLHPHEVGKAPVEGDTSTAMGPGSATFSVSIIRSCARGHGLDRHGAQELLGYYKDIPLLQFWGQENQGSSYLNRMQVILGLTNCTLL